MSSVYISSSISWAVDRHRCECTRNWILYVFKTYLRPSRTDSSIVIVYKWAYNGTMAINLAKKSNVWGVVCLSAVDFVYVFSTSLWRTKSYNFFLTTHFVGYTLLIPSVSISLIYATFILTRHLTSSTNTTPPRSLSSSRSWYPSA